MGSSAKKVFILVFIALGILAAIFLVVIVKKPKPVPVAPVVETPVVTGPIQTVLGTSVEGRDIVAHTYGTGAKHLVFVGGIHGGYEWNSVLLAYQFMDYLAANPAAVPASVRVTIIPSLNPDAVFKVTKKEGRFTATDVTTDETLLASARFNARAVDLNRNFDCKWQPKSNWRSKEVSAGTAPLSEPEAKAFADFALAQKPTAVVFWHSQASAAYPSYCESGVSSTTADIHSAYAQASGYKAEAAFTAYEITGDSADWLSTIGVPAITVELTNHESTEWEKNLKGIQALLNYFK